MTLTFNFQRSDNIHSFDHNKIWLLSKSNAWYTVLTFSVVLRWSTNSDLKYGSGVEALAALRKLLLYISVIWISNAIFWYFLATLTSASYLRTISLLWHPVSIFWWLHYQFWKGIFLSKMQFKVMCFYLALKK